MIFFFDSNSSSKSNLTRFFYTKIIIILQSTKQWRVERDVVDNQDFQQIDDIDNFDFDKLSSNYNINLQKNMRIEKQSDFQTIEKIRFCV